MLWLEAHKTNTDPKIIAGYFMDVVIAAAWVRLDLGTENDHVAELQQFCIFLRTKLRGTLSFGPSMGNQHIERWWLTLRSECVQIWMDLFAQIREDGHFLDNFWTSPWSNSASWKPFRFAIDTSKFCYGLNTCLIYYTILQSTGCIFKCHKVQNCIIYNLFVSEEEFDEVLRTWNNHRVHRVHNSRSPHGCPSIMYAVPHLYGSRDYLNTVPIDKVSFCLEECAFKDFPCNEDMLNICVDLMSEYNLSLSNDVYKTVELYIHLTELINNELQQW